MKNVIILFMFITVAIFGETYVEIIEKLDKNINYKSQKSIGEMTIINSDGKKTNMEFEALYKKGEDDKQLMKFTKPARLKGTAILSVGENIWYYNKRTNRVRMLSQSAKNGSMMGSSFTYDDMNTDYKDDFTGEILSETDNTYILKMFPKKEGKNYKYIVVEVSKDTFLEKSAKYYDENDILYKKMNIKTIKKIDNYIAPLEIEMIDILDKKTTILKISEKSVEFDLELADRTFSERNLKR